MATVTRAPAWARSATSSSVSRIRTWVPTGTASSRPSPRRPCLARALAVRAPLRPEVRRLAEAGQVAQVAVGDQDDIAAVAAVTAVGAALGHVLLAPEADAAVAAAAALDIDRGSVGEHREPRPAQAAGSEACTLM